MNSTIPWYYEFFTKEKELPKFFIPSWPMVEDTCLHRFEKPGEVSMLSCPCPKCTPRY